MAAQVFGQLGGRAVPPTALLLEAFHDDPIEIASEPPGDGAAVAPRTPGGAGGRCRRPRHPGRGPRRYLLAQDSLHLPQARPGQSCALEGSGAGEQLVEQGAEGVDVGAGVDIEGRHLRLLGAHVGGGADQPMGGGEKGLVGEPAVHGLGDTEIDHLGQRPAVLDRHQHVRGLEVAVNHAFLVGMLHGGAHLEEELDPLHRTQTLVIAILGDRQTAYQLHHEIGPARGRVGGTGQTAVEHLGDRGVIHQRQGLPLGLEAGYHLAGLHSALDQLQGHLATHGLLLLGAIHHPEAALTEDLEQAVSAEGGSRGFEGRIGRARASRRRPLEGIPPIEIGEHGREARAQGRLDCSSLEKGAPLARGQVGRLLEELLETSKIAHGPASPDLPPSESSARSQARMKRHSRSTVPTETPRASAVSAAVRPAK